MVEKPGGFARTEKTVLPPRARPKPLMTLHTRGDSAVKCSTFARCSLLACLLISYSLGFARADNWPHWRGPTHDGVSKETNLPTEWSETEERRLEAAAAGHGRLDAHRLGRPHLPHQRGRQRPRAPVRQHRRQGTVEAQARQRQSVRARDEGNVASPSPSTDGKHVWAFVGTGDFACFDFDGKEVWKFNAQERYGKFKIQFGHAHHAGAGRRPALPAVDPLRRRLGHRPRQGHRQGVWKVERKSDGRAECEHSYASPCIWHNGKDALPDHARQRLRHRPPPRGRQGDLARRRPQPQGPLQPTLRFVASPVATPDLIVVPSAKNGPVVGVKPDATRHDRGRQPLRAMAQAQRHARRAVAAGPRRPVYLCGENGHPDLPGRQDRQELYRERTHSTATAPRRSTPTARFT